MLHQITIYITLHVGNGARVSKIMYAVKFHTESSKGHVLIRDKG